MDEDQIEMARYWMEVWAQTMRRCRAEIIAEVAMPPTTTIGALALTNWSASEDDLGEPYRRLESAQAEMVDAVMEDLRAEVPWAYWAVCRKHRLGSMGMVEYEKMAEMGVLPPGLYLSALEEVAPMLERRGLT